MRPNHVIAALTVFVLILMHVGCEWGPDPPPQKEPQLLLSGEVMEQKYEAGHCTEILFKKQDHTMITLYIWGSTNVWKGMKGSMLIQHRPNDSCWDSISARED